MKKTYIELSGLTGCITLATIAAAPFLIAWGVILITRSILSL